MKFHTGGKQTKKRFFMQDYTDFSTKLESG